MAHRRTADVVNAPRVLEHLIMHLGGTTMARINYPDSWSQHHRDELDAMFAKARAEGLWFFISSLLVEPMWFSPDELEAKQKEGQFVWSAENWRLRHPQEY